MKSKDEMNNYKESKEADYLDFIKDHGPPPPEKLEWETKMKIRQLLNPSLSQISVKILTVHLFLGFLAFAICPQFGFKYFGEGIGLHRYFMIFGHEVCMVLCGMLLFGITYSASVSILTLGEIRKFNEYKGLITFLLTLITLTPFLIMRSPALPSIQEVLNWVFGAFSGGILLFEISSKLKRS